MKTDPFEGYVDAEVIEIFKTDDKERFVRLLSAYAHTVNLKNAVRRCALFHAKKCLLAIIQGEAGISPHQLYAREAAQYSAEPTPLAYVAYFFPEADDIIDLMLKQGPADQANIKCKLYTYAFDDHPICPLDHALLSFSYKPHLLPWSSGDSLIKLIILLCQWETRPSLNCARLLAPHTDRLNNIALSYVKQGKLASFAALLLVAQEKVLVPFDSGLTIRQRIIEMVQKLNSKKGDLDYEEALFQSMLIEVYKLLDIFERAGAALSLYCTCLY
ncbi:uncharacterized protein LOC141648343 [Silene latifolia]|uniref:uncharacterized protein LOC141648343 n=1 Tax=Silene latifolia TaxID=37657 RepID=UPI003D76A87A